MEEVLKYINGILFLVFVFIYVCWVLGIRFSKEKQEQYNANKNHFRKKLNESWDAYRKENTYSYTQRVNIVDEWGNTKGSYDRFGFNDPGTRYKSQLFLGPIALVIYAILIYFVYHFFGSWIAGISAVSFLGYTLYFFKDNIIYESWYYKIMYSIWIGIYIGITVNIIN
jgi:hypothetical protein